MNFLIAIGAVIVVALLVAALVDYRRRKLGDTKSGLDIWRSVRSQKADARKRGERWGAGQRRLGRRVGGTSRQSLSR
ncbi:hypothetical protein KRR39_04105 [Nocardioides panacis]|uniref:Uncharacterized protein n=1 Tax=Nocardioides panacis TaxID=2849501 RepID=A0A975Y151_9ACTN|nr:hypothetical protein [Nocardioides panacis]QWZ09019.1 hypothetical protein KRR39_04105 [Nocardioides panacis]